MFEVSLLKISVQFSNNRSSWRTSSFNMDIHSPGIDLQNWLILNMENPTMIFVHFPLAYFPSLFKVRIFLPARLLSILIKSTREILVLG